MNLVIFSHDLPYPAIHGARIDVYNRLRALKGLNHNVFLITWAQFEDNNSEVSIRQIGDIVTTMVCFRRRENILDKVEDIFGKLMKLPFQSSVVTQCTLSNVNFKAVLGQIRDFEPNALFVESIYAGNLAYKFSLLLKLPLFIRSHNVEHIYIQRQFSLSTTIKDKLKYFLMNSNLKNFENSILKKADAVFDISLSDIDYWNSRGHDNIHWMPPIFLRYNSTECEVQHLFEYDISYIGNLNSPNNIEGLFWFFEKIMPEIVQKHPGLKILIAGSNPVQKLVDYCLLNNNLILLPNPANLSLLYNKTIVLINPILSGRGVNIKSIEMLHVNRPVVCTSKAIKGLPPEIENVFDISDEASDFAAKVLNRLNETSYIMPSKANILEYFHPNYLNKSIRVMENICSKRG